MGKWKCEKYLKGAGGQATILITYCMEQNYIQGKKPHANKKVSANVSAISSEFHVSIYEMSLKKIIHTAGTLRECKKQKVFCLG